MENEIQMRYDQQTSQCSQLQPSPYSQESSSFLSPTGTFAAGSTPGAYLCDPAQQQSDYQYLEQLSRFWDSEMTRIEEVSDFKSHELPLARIKKIMKGDTNVKMISAEVPVLFAKACEIFTRDCTSRSWMHTLENRRKTLQRSDIMAGISQSAMFDFLVNIVPRDDLKLEGPLSGIPQTAFPFGTPVETLHYPNMY